jgi:hypothetical protein
VSAPDEIAELQHELAGLRRQVRVLQDRAEIGDLLDRYTTSMDRLDATGFDDAWARSMFTDDVVLEYPPGTHHGIHGVGHFHAEVMGRFEATWHLSGNHLVDLDGDRADVRMTLTATHVHPPETRGQRGEDPFVVGDYFDAEVVRAPAGWRIRWMRLTVVWVSGVPPLIVAGGA